MKDARIIIQKYGGSSVATIAKLEDIARRVAAKKASGFDVVVVVSAMGNTTDELLKRAAEIMAQPPARELDMLLSTGERMTMALLSIAMQKYGLEAISFTGSQAGIITTNSHSHARIISVRPYRVQDELANGKVVIVAGFQGTSYKNEITTLGRGGSDMTAIALAGALDAEACEIYSDVDGVYSADPKIVLDAQKLDVLTSAEMLEMAQHGAKVLHDGAILYAHRHQISLYAKRSHDDQSQGTFIRPDGWPEYALEAARLKPVAVVTAKKILWLSLDVADPWTWIEELHRHDGIKVMALTVQKSHIEAVLDVWDCHDEGSLQRLGAEGRGEVRGDVRNVTLTGPDIGRRTAFILEASHALGAVHVSALSMFTEVNAITFVVRDEDLVAASNALHALVTRAPSAG